MEAAATISTLMGAASGRAKASGSASANAWKGYRPSTSEAREPRLEGIRGG